MKKLLFVSKTRGFFSHLFKSKSQDWIYLSKGPMYEKYTRKRKIISNVGRSTIFDKIGFIQVVKTDDESADVHATYNRFLRSKKPYVIYLENPTALFHYKLEREESFFGRKNIKKLINNPNLKAIICMSKACEDGFKKIFSPYIVRDDLIIEQIYPLVLDPVKQTQETTTEGLKLLFIAQGRGFVSKGGIELLNVMKRLSKENYPINLTMICSREAIPIEYQEIILELPNITFLEFGIPFEELQKVYYESSILVHLTKQDSFGLTILEAQKYGLPIISTNLYSIPELVTDGVNGYLIDPTVWFFYRNNLPNKEVWNNRDETIFLEKSDIDIEEFLYEKVTLLSENRVLLKELSDNSRKISRKRPFSQEYILNKWNTVLEKIELENKQ